MEKRTAELEKIMTERFGRDSILAVATTENNVPYVRNVDAFYEAGAFYIITHALSGKMQQIAKNPMTAVAGEWFTGHGEAENMGYFGAEKNARIAEKLREAFAAWIDNGHNNFEDTNTCILCIRLTDGILFAEGKRYEIDFKGIE